MDTLEQGYAAESSDLEKVTGRRSQDMATLSSGRSMADHHAKNPGVITCCYQHAVWCHCLLPAKHMVRTFRNQVFWREILPFYLLPERTPLHLPDADLELPESEGVWATP
jgi:hypothetical protein